LLDSNYLESIPQNISSSRFIDFDNKLLFQVADFPILPQNKSDIIKEIKDISKLNNLTIDYSQPERNFQSHINNIKK
jgi:hypothetical protein